MADPTETEETPEPEPTETEAEEKPEGEEEAKPDDAEAKAEGEAEDPKEGAEEAKDGQPEPEARKRVGGWQRKIERLERQNEVLTQQLGTRPPPQPNGKPAAEQTADEKAAAYIDNLVEQRLAKKEQERQQQTAQAEFQRRTQEVRAQNPDFDEVVMSADMPVSPGVREALLTSEHGPAIMYQLAKSPSELARLNALPDLVAAREIGRLEAKLSSVAAVPVKPKPALRPPAPPTSVNGSTANTRSLDELPISEYKRAMRSGRR